MSRLSSSKIFIFPLSMLCITLLASIIAMLPSTSADISPLDDTVTITVDSACTMGQTVLQSSNTLNPGETSTIGGSRIAAYCNDSEGYAIYAIGYTSGEYGNTNLISAQNPNHTIPTGTSSTLGNASYWNMQLTPGTASDPSSTHIPTIENNFTSISNIPANYTKVASYPSTTIPQQQDPTTSGSYFTTTYQSHISTTQPAGVYTGQVQYVMVHPTTAPPPTFMQDTDTIKSRLINYGDTMQAIDKRDGKKYWITKLADGNIWMTQNLDLDIDSTKTYTSADTDLPAGITWKPSVSTYTDNTWTSSNITPESYDPGDRYWNGIAMYPGGTIDSNTTTSGNAHYHIGNYYNWTTAVAMNDTSTYIVQYQAADQSICPSGWRLPGYSGDKSFEKLKRDQNLTAGVAGNIQNSPVYLSYTPGWGGNPQAIGIGDNGYYWSNTVYSSRSSYVLELSYYYSGVDPQSMGMGGVRMFGRSVRCVAR